MTICIGAIDNSSITIGCDSLWSWGEDFVREQKTSKFIEIPDKFKNNIVIASSGQDRFTQIFRKTIKKNPDLLGFTDLDSIMSLVESLQLEIRELGIGDPETNELPEHNMGFLIGSIYTNSLWIIESDYNVCEFNDHVCIGSGSFLGESSMLALKSANIVGENAVRISIDSVIKLHPYCGGSVHIKTLKR